MSTRINRRRLLAGAAAGLVGSAGVRSSRGGSEAKPTAAAMQRAVRFAHFTDTHMHDGRGAARGLTQALQHVQDLDDPPEFIVTGGDEVSSALVSDADRTRKMWDLWRRVWREECSLPREHVIGNHDIWGWDKQRSQTTGSESRWGKQWALEVFGLSKPYRSFDRNGWHFVILDPCQPSATQTYTAFLDDEQFAWLAKDLAATDKNTPIVVISHIPILTVTTLLTARPNQEERPTDWTVPGHLMLRDARRVHELFRQHPNVKLALSGHIHQVDRVDYEGVTYICGGAICGAWWGGNYRGMEEGYGLIDLYRGGEFAYQYVPYGWKR